MLTMSKTRTKSFSRRESFWSQYTYDTVTNPPLVSSSSVSTISSPSLSIDSTVTVGENYPDWKQRIKLGQNATTTMDGTITRITVSDSGHYEAGWVQEPIVNPNGRYESRHDSFGGHLGANVVSLPSGSFISSMSAATATNRALARFNDKVAAVNHQFQGGVFFGELAEALHGIRHPAEALFKGIEGYSIAATKLRRTYVKSRSDLLSLSKTQRRKVVKSFAEAVGGLWLERSFHWLPLMGDIRGAVNALTATLDRMPSQFVKVSATDEQFRSATQGTFAGPRLSDGVYSQLDTRGVTVRMYGRVQVGVRTPGVPSPELLGFDLSSFVPTIWELIPYSWAVDYFTNIGDIIYGASQGGCDVMWAAIGTKTWEKRTTICGIGSRVIPPTSGWHYTTYYSLGRASEVLAEKAKISRATYGGSFVPQLEFKIPGLSLKWLNLGALFLQRSASFL